MAKLLIVDDEVDIREFAKNFFAKRKIEVFTSSGASEAFKIIEEEKPDLVLLDVRMEEMTGVELLRILREEMKNPIKVIMVTGVEEEEVVKEANRLGVKGYIYKPLILDELEKIVLKEI